MWCVLILIDYVVCILMYELCCVLQVRSASPLPQEAVPEDGAVVTLLSKQECEQRERERALRIGFFCTLHHTHSPSSGERWELLFFIYYFLCKDGIMLEVVISSVPVALLRCGVLFMSSLGDRRSEEMLK